MSGVRFVRVTNLLANTNCLLTNWSSNKSVVDQSPVANLTPCPCPKGTGIKSSICKSPSRAPKVQRFYKSSICWERRFYKSVPLQIEDLLGSDLLAQTNLRFVRASNLLANLLAIVPRRFARRFGRVRFGRKKSVRFSNPTLKSNSIYDL